MAHLFTGLTAEGVGANLERVRTEVAAAAERSGRDAADIEILAACKYVPCEELPVLSAAGITLVGENRVQALTEKVAAHGELFTWDFIGTLQSKHVRAIVPHVRLIHSLATESALAELGRQANRARPGMEVLIEVNLAEDPSKQGIAPEQLAHFIDRSPFPVAGLMTMPPLAQDRNKAAPGFAACASLQPSTGCGSSRWAPPRTSPSPWKRARRLCASAHGLYA